VAPFSSCQPAVVGKWVPRQPKAQREPPPSHLTGTRRLVPVLSLSRRSGDQSWGSRLLVPRSRDDCVSLLGGWELTLPAVLVVKRTTLPVPGNDPLPRCQRPDDHVRCTQVLGDDPHAVPTPRQPVPPLPRRDHHSVSALRGPVPPVAEERSGAMSCRNRGARPATVALTCARRAVARGSAAC
jgi:hypothetical protein